MTFFVLGSKTQHQRNLLDESLLDSLRYVANYDFTNLSFAFSMKAAEKLEGWSGFDVEVDPVQQGHGSRSYGLVVAANVVHVITCVENTMRSINGLLKPAGTVVLISTIFPKKTSFLVEMVTLLKVS